MSNDRFLKARTAKANTDFVQGVNDDVTPTPATKAKFEAKALVAQTITTRGNKQLAIEPNALSNKERSRVKHGRSLITHLYVEELEAIEQAVEELGEPSIANFVRDTLLAKAQSALGKDRFNATLDNKRNVVK